MLDENFIEKGSCWMDGENRMESGPGTVFNLQYTEIYEVGGVPVIQHVEGGVEIRYRYLWNVWRLCACRPPVRDRSVVFRYRYISIKSI